MGGSSPLVMEDSDLEEGKPGRQTHHMGQYGQRHVVRLNDPNYMPCHLVITILATAGGGTDALGFRHQGKISEDLGFEQPASALMRSPVCHPQCGYNDWEKSGGGCANEEEAALGDGGPRNEVERRQNSGPG